MERISWQELFLELCTLTARRSPCTRLHVGCVIVKNNRVISTGYNGFLPGAQHKSIVVDNHEQATVHAEQNCVSDCAKRGVQMDGAEAYITHFPCVSCFKSLIAAGITKIYYINEYKNPEIVETIAKDIGIQIIKC